MHVRRAALIAVLALLAAACGSSGTATKAPGIPTIAPGGGGSTQAPGVTPAGGGGGGGGTAGIPQLANGGYTKGQAHIEITGDKAFTYDLTGVGFATGGSGALTYTDSTKNVSTNLVFADQGSSGLAIVTPDLIAGGSWGTECKESTTRNDGSGITGSFECDNVQAAAPGGLTAFHVTVKGTFSADR